MGRDVGSIQLTEDEPDPTWAVELYAEAGPPSPTGQDTVVVPTPLGARAYDVATGELE